jgi:hypothetical protein
MLERFQNPVANFNESDIETHCKEVNGVSRVFVQTPNNATTAVTVTLTRMDDGTNTNVAGLATIDSGTFSFFTGQPLTISGSGFGDYNVADANGSLLTSTTLTYPIGNTAENPSGSAATITGSDVPVGTTRIYFMRDNDLDANGDADPFPSASEVSTVNDVVQSLRPGNASILDTVVSAPTENTIDFAFASIFPDSETMQAAIISSLKDMMIQRTSVGLGLTEEVYKAVIGNTYDEENAQYLESFTLTDVTSSISGVETDITGVTGALPWLGDTSFD